MAPSARPATSPAVRAAVLVLLIAAIIAALLVPIYARFTPKLGAFPFFYWYQLILVPAVALVCWLCYLLLRPPPAHSAGSRSRRAARRGAR